jgi:hypothetical protein
MDVSYGPEELGFESLQEQQMYLFSCETYPESYTMGKGGFFSGTTRLEREADNSPTSNAEVKN